jgi:RNA-directed DNA polymerase
MSLPNPHPKVQKLQQSLHAKAKAEPGFRFYSLWDKVCRKDVLESAYRACRANSGAAGVDRESFSDIETGGLNRWLENLQRELMTGTYRPSPLLRVWIPKASGGRRPLGIPTIRDRVAQMAALLVLGPIFEADLPPQQYGFRSGLDAKMAVRRVYFHVTERERREIVDGDLSDYFTSIPHALLMKCVTRRISDSHILAVIKGWLEAPVIERVGRGQRRTTEARDTHRGTPQGGVISPLLSNLYFRRFVLAWGKLGIQEALDARIVNYADDFVICCPPGKGKRAMNYMRGLMRRLGLQVNERKTRLVTLPEETFDFLGYTFGRCHGKNGRAYIGTRPSRKALKRVLRRIHEETSRRWVTSTLQKRVEELNYILRGWCGYFNQGPVSVEYRIVRRYVTWRLRRWLMRKHKRRGTGGRQFPDRYLFGVLGLYEPVVRRTSPPCAKA